MSVGVRSTGSASSSASLPRISHRRVDLGGFGHLFRDRSGFQGAFWSRLLSEPRTSGRVLDIGCGGQPFPAEQEIQKRAAQCDGVDPSGGVLTYPGLAERWQGKFEAAPIPESAYDLAWAYNVVEHIEHARPFFEKLRRILKPGGVFWALTPHGHHPFCTAVRLLQATGIKQRLAERDPDHVNAIPSYYRLNTSSQVLEAVRGLGFASADFHYMPCMQWDRTFPRFMRLAPWAYDWLIGTRFNRYSLVVAYRLEVAAG